MQSLQSIHQPFTEAGHSFHQGQPNFQQDITKIKQVRVARSQEYPEDNIISYIYILYTYIISYHTYIQGTPTVYIYIIYE